MRVDTGLQDGIGGLRRDDQLLDLTLKVDGQEFRVHKVVLASVSDYFRAMFCGSMRESKSDVIELKEISAEQVSRLLDFIYTGECDDIENYPKEMLECGLYFQIQKLIEEYTERLTKSLCVCNCVELLSTFLKFPVNDTAQKVLNFIKANLRKVLDCYKLNEITLEIICIAHVNWGKSEWELFNYLKSWISVDDENRQRYLNDLMSHVRFKLMTPDEITAVKETGLYAECDGSWRGLVNKAAIYHQLPIHQKVVDKSRQSCVRSSKSVFVMETGRPVYARPSRTHVLAKYGAGHDVWKRYKAAKAPQLRGKYPVVIEVNNFLIACHQYERSEECFEEHTPRDEFGRGQQWQIFDPRTLGWYGMASMPKDTLGFSLVHHGNHLYVLGGCCAVTGSLSNTVFIYNFESNSWSLGKELPIAVKDTAACVFQDAIYVSGGEHGEYDDAHHYGRETARMDCYKQSSQMWESKAPMLTENRYHSMFVMTIKQEECIVIIQELLTVDYYNPRTDQWSHYNAKDYLLFCPDDLPIIRLCENTSILARGNTVYLLKLRGGDGHQGQYPSCKEHEYIDSVCAKLTVPVDGSEVVQSIIGAFPIRDVIDDVKAVCGVLAFPARSTPMDT